MGWGTWLLSVGSLFISSSEVPITVALGTHVVLGTSCG